MLGYAKPDGVGLYGSTLRQNNGGSVRGINGINVEEWTQLTVTYYPQSGPANIDCIWMHDVVGGLRAKVSTLNRINNIITDDLLNIIIGGAVEFTENSYSAPYKVGSIAYVDGVLTEAELSEIARDKNILDPKYTNDVLHYWEFFDDWGANPVPNLGLGTQALVMPPEYIYDTDNPLTPIKLEGTQRTGFGNILQIESSIAGTIYATRQVKDSTPPADAAAVINATVGGDVLEVINGAIAVSTLTDFEFTTADSFTEYDYYFALDDGGTTQVLGDEEITIETCGFVENDEPLADIDGVALTNLSGVRVGWFDTTNPQGFNVVNGKQLDLDSGGFFRLSLPNSSLAQGLEGTLVLYCNSDGTERTQSIVFEVK